MLLAGERLTACKGTTTRHFLVDGRRGTVVCERRRTSWQDSTSPHFWLCGASSGRIKWDDGRPGPSWVPATWVLTSGGWQNFDSGSSQSSVRGKDSRRTMGEARKEG
ncbi:hypothetical protein CPAR01_16053 [Colletotrichum paranaense]|uniref:Uncharacterized protein n=1 Tax=Colletotrichum paranaense TaxID=1914294 RepID=A0ABQ9RXH5_9PEZI|nr:uncharacterized protein CPAR01_16053 [Colletotrichum paranaense]KAK1517573.1 hypothetical protein CPAR01_16053 [Colletotrichum paranaense]